MQNKNTKLAILTLVAMSIAIIFMSLWALFPSQEEQLILERGGLELQQIELHQTAEAIRAESEAKISALQTQYAANSGRIEEIEAQLFQ